MEEERQKNTLLACEVNDIHATRTSECKGAESQGPGDKGGEKGTW